MIQLQDKVALVTGSARRVGREIALALAREGCHLAVHFNRSAEAAGAAADEIRRLGRRAEVFRADLREPGQIAELFQAVGKAFGMLDVLVNNAAVYNRTPLEGLTAEQWDSQMAVNARAPALCIRHAVGLMSRHGGTIINICDISAEKAWAGYPAYCASKAALLALTRSAAKALAGHNIRVNAVSPGVAMWQEGADEQEKQQVLAQIPLGRPGSSGDVAAAVVFLAQQDYVTGQNLRVDGGWCMR